MQNLTSVLSASLLALGLGWASGMTSNLQEEQDTADKPEQESYLSRQAKRQAQTNEDLLGAWMLTDYLVSDKLFEGADALRGWLMIHDGYLSWTIYGSEESSSLFGNGRRANLESVLYRYRVSPTLELQMASMLGFSDLPDTGGLVFDDGHNALQFELILTDGNLTLDNPGVETLSFRRMNPSEFPERALQALESGIDLKPLDEER